MGAWLVLYLLCDVQVAGVDAVCEQVLGAAALAGAEHAVVGLEQLTAGRRAHERITGVCHKPSALPSYCASTEWYGVTLILVSDSPSERRAGNLPVGAETTEREGLTIHLFTCCYYNTGTGLLLAPETTLI